MEILLSVCVPTFNGAQRIVSCLNALSVATCGLSKVEVLISDNCSTDSTFKIINDFTSISNFRVYRNEKNLGFNGNLERIIGNYANGKYCWIIGDDDIVDPDALIKICEILEKYSPSFVSVNHRVLSLNDFTNLRINIDRELEYVSDNYFRCIDINASSSNLLGTFMSSQIFLLKDIRTKNDLHIAENRWDDFKTTFPNSYMMTRTFYKSTNCGCVRTEVLTAIIHEKSWEDKMNVIAMKILPNYYNFCLKLSCDKKSLTRTKEILDCDIFNRNVKYMKTLSLNKVKWSAFFSTRTYNMLFKYLKNKI